MVSSRVRRNHPLLDQAINDMMKRVEKKTGARISFTEGARLVGEKYFKAKGAFFEPKIPLNNIRKDLK